MRPLNELMAELPEVTWADGKAWFDQGLTLFRQHQMAWFGLAFVLLLGISLTNSVPTLGLVLMAFVSPLVTALWFAFLAQGAQPNRRLVEAWPRVNAHLTPLLMLGVALLGLTFLTQWLNETVLTALGFGLLDDAALESISTSEVLQRTLLAVMVNLPMIMVMTFSPALLLGVLDNVWSAMQLSAMAVLKSWRGFVVVVLMMFLLVFGVLLLASMVFSVLVLILGSAGQLLANVLAVMMVMLIMGIGMTVQYVAYRHLFPKAADDQAMDEPSQIEL